MAFGRWRFNLRREHFGRIKWRGLIADCTDTAELAKENLRAHHALCGFDPTADSLHVGNLVPLLALRRFQLLGHHPIAVAGGATGSIGDPSGKTAERQLLTKEILDRNIASVKVQLAKLLDFETKQNPARLVDNAAWTRDISFLDFLRDIGKHFSVNQMVAKESVRARMEDREVGISYTEFSYMLLQAFDFMVLCARSQLRTADRRQRPMGQHHRGHRTHAQENRQTGFRPDAAAHHECRRHKVWQNRSRRHLARSETTSVYKFYQFWINVDDRDVIRYLKYFTFLTQEEIESLEKQHAENPGARVAHKALAKAVTDLVHGSNATKEAIKTSQAFFTGSVAELPQSSIFDARQELPGPVIEDPAQLPLNKTLTEVVTLSGLAPSKGQARRDIEAGGIYLNDKQEKNPDRIVIDSDYLYNQFLILRKGKKNYSMISGSAPISNPQEIPPPSID